jgi:hypothetical protein
VYYEKSIPAIDASKGALLWVDRASSEEILSHLQWIDTNKQVQARLATNTLEARKWIEDNAAVLVQLASRSHFRIITNRYVIAQHL